MLSPSHPPRALSLPDEEVISREGLPMQVHLHVVWNVRAPTHDDPTALVHAICQVALRQCARELSWAEIHRRRLTLRRFLDHGNDDTLAELGVEVTEVSLPKTWPRPRHAAG